MPADLELMRSAVDLHLLAFNQRPNVVSRVARVNSWLRASYRPSSDHPPRKPFDVSEIGGIILLVAEAKADAKAKASDTKPTEYEKAVTGKK